MNSRQEVEQLWKIRKDELSDAMEADIRLWNMFDYKAVKRRKNFFGVASRIDKMLDRLIIFDLEEEVKKYAETGLKYIEEAKVFGFRKSDSRTLEVDEAGYLYRFYKYRFKWIIYSVDDEDLAREALQILWSTIEKRIARKNFKHILYDYIECVYLAIKCRDYIIAKECLEYMSKKEEKNKNNIIYNQSTFLKKIVDSLEDNYSDKTEIKKLFEMFFCKIKNDINILKIYGQYAVDVSFIYFKYFCEDKNKFNPIDVTKSIRDGIV